MTETLCYMVIGQNDRLSHHRDDGTLSVTHHYVDNDANQLVDRAAVWAPVVVGWSRC